MRIIQELVPYCRIVIDCPAGYVALRLVSEDSLYTLIIVAPLPAPTASVPLVPALGPVEPVCGWGVMY